MKVKYKLLLLIFAFICFFCIKSNATIYYPVNNAYNLEYDDYNNGSIDNILTYSYLHNLGIDNLYDIFYYQTRASQYGSFYDEYCQVLYVNHTTNEYIVHYFYSNYYNDYKSFFYYIHNNSCVYITDFYTYKNYNDYSRGNGCIVYDYNSDNTLKNIYYFDVIQTPTYNDNNYFRVYIDNDFNIYTMGNTNFYSYNISTGVTTTKYPSYDMPWVCISTLTEFNNYNINDYGFCPTIYALCCNNQKPWSFSNNDYTDFHSSYCNGIYEDSGNIPFYGDYSDSIVVWSVDIGIVHESSKEINLYVQDINLKKQFNFNFSLPNHKEDSVYYAFLTSYNRTSISSVSADFVVYELFTPLSYDGTFDKYLLYDEDGDYFTPCAGINVIAYKGSCSNNGTFSISDTSNITEVTAIYNKGMLFSPNGPLADIFDAHFQDNFMIPSSKLTAQYTSSLMTIANTFALSQANNIIHKIGIDTDIPYSVLKKYMYYGNFVINGNGSFDNTAYFRVGDMCFSTGNVYSYSNNSNGMGGALNYYDILQNTKVRDHTKYKVNTSDNSYLILYTDSQDTSSLFPSGTNVNFLNGPYFTFNNNTYTNGNLTGDLQGIINGPKPINYTHDYSPILSVLSDSILSGFQQGDNIIPNNNDIQMVDMAGDLRKTINSILLTLCRIEDMIDNLSISIDNSVSNTYNIVNNYVKPDFMKIKQKRELLEDTWVTHLGFIYDIPQTVIYALTYIQDFDNDTPITITIPSVTIFDYNLIQEYTYSFTDLFESNQTFNNFHNIILVMSDCILMCLLLQLGKNCYERMVKD